MAQVGIVMGSDSDMPVMSKAADILEKFGIDYEMKIISAHREPDVFFDYAKRAIELGVTLVQLSVRVYFCTVIVNVFVLSLVPFLVSVSPTLSPLVVTSIALLDGSSIFIAAILYFLPLILT